MFWRSLCRLVLGVDNDSEFLLKSLSWLMVSLGGVTFVLLKFVDLPYGRYACSKFGFPVNVKIAWFIQELPSLTVPLYLVCFSTDINPLSLPNRLLLGMFIGHYIHRSLIFPFLIKGGKATPFIPFALAFTYCAFNGYLQARFLSKYAIYPSNWITDPRFLTGFALWFFGLSVNLHSDHILRKLRKPNETGYKIPHGGMFEYVSGANFLGEIIEWTGFAIACWSLPSAAFAIFGFFILSSRATQHHRWYLEKFEDYPKSRKALIPFVY
ncbi:3-oxo-5-alpha-steroid 4-dehydrogenase 1 [Hemiscyllium ocellatum]|uniref:3-oxo-5-alpha-steroid 4-dehydrogenase 1 n=1 Tax=Hemiscyllium ocellatum TaxID=170820 RepID=UPI0029672E28|nr:3-oxo-5-alpha-steroid 4-dehydrogenase 1 [Hemiscyllium ocellatum]